jgi:hypothetical protein
MRLITDVINNLERFEIYNNKNEVVLTISHFPTKTDSQGYWIEKPDGEGGEFSKDKISKLLLDFFEENF